MCAWGVCEGVRVCVGVGLGGALCVHARVNVPHVTSAHAPGCVGSWEAGADIHAPPPPCSCASCLQVSVEGVTGTLSHFFVEPMTPHTDAQEHYASLYSDRVSVRAVGVRVVKCIGVLEACCRCAGGAVHRRAVGVLEACAWCSA